MTERECLAVIFCIDNFRPFIEGTKFTVITDHHFLLCLNRLKDPSGKLARCAAKLQQHPFNFIHRRRKHHIVPDALSRIPLSIISITPVPEEKWYTSLRSKIVSNLIEDGIIVPANQLLISNSREWKILVPNSQRKKVIRNNHDTILCFHPGMTKTLA